MNAFGAAVAAAFLQGTLSGTIAFAASPVIDWTSSYNGPGSELEQVRDVAVQNGFLYVVGGTTVNVQGTGYITIKYSPDGTEAWSRIYEGFVGGANQSDVAQAVAVDAAGNVYVSGHSYQYVPHDPVTGPEHILVDAVTLKYSPGGDLLWEHRYRGSGGNVQPAAIVLDPAGFVYVTGATWIGEGFDVLLLKYDLEGQLLWSRTHGQPTGQSADAAFAMALDGDGNVVLGGYTQPGDLDVYVLSYAPDGALRWEWTLHGRSNVEEVIDLTVDGAGNTYALAQYAPTFGHTSLLTVKLSRNGVLVWSDVYSGQSTGDYGAGVELSPDGNLFVAGAAWENGSQNAMTLLKYTPDGERLWVRSQRGGFYSAEGNDLAVDDEGAAYVTGHAFDVNEDMQYLTSKYDGAGNHVWTVSWAAPEGRTDIAYHVRVGTDRRVYVVGDAWRDFSRYFDITSVVYRQDGLVDVPTPAPGIRVELLAPNPAIAGSTISVRSIGAAPVEVFGIDGRRILTLPAGRAAGETVRFTAPGSPGLYIVRSGAWTRKLAIVRP
ncbi:MAG: hypothetical protein ACREOU_15850 [Candidatus Eiseniibacteriota bacterium]